MFTPTPRAILLIDLAFGDAGKGTIVDFLTRQTRARTVVRFNGGPQAGHNVVTKGGRHHTFSQFASGTLVPGVRTLLSRFMLIEPYALLNEADHLRALNVPDALDRLLIDRACPVITPCHQAANRLRELARGPTAHGTCGLGIGETMQDLLDHPDLTLHATDLPDAATVRRKLLAVRELKLSQLHDLLPALADHPKARFPLETLHNPSWIDSAIATYQEVATRARLVDHPSLTDLTAGAPIIFEGAQGVLLDEWFGFHPHTTWSTTTFANADQLLDESHFPHPRTRLGVLRTYATRHGAGPLVTEDPTLAPLLPEPHNTPAGWQGHFRVGPFDAVAARYALSVTGPVDALALTHLDRVPSLPPRISTAYECDHPDNRFFRHRENRITHILPHTPPDLVRQEQLTHLLQTCRPVYTSLDHDPAAFLALVGRELNAPVRLTSSGPTALDKAWTPSAAGGAGRAIAYGAQREGEAPPEPPVPPAGPL